MSTVTRRQNTTQENTADLSFFNFEKRGHIAEVPYICRKKVVPNFAFIH